MSRLAGLAALVTGGARGIGSATAHRPAVSFITGQTIDADGGRRL